MYIYIHMGTRTTFTNMLTPTLAGLHTHASTELCGITQRPRRPREGNLAHRTSRNRAGFQNLCLGCDSVTYMRAHASHTPTQTHTCMRTYASIYMRAHMHTYTQRNTHMKVHAHVCVCVCMCVNTCV